MKRFFLFVVLCAVVGGIFSIAIQPQKNAAIANNDLSSSVMGFLMPVAANADTDTFKPGGIDPSPPPPPIW